jgi:N-acetylneuraminic acid mutarotase
VTATPGNPVPTITQLSPPSLAAGATPQTLTIGGTGFLPSSTVTFNGISHTATFVGATQLTISLISADLTTAGSYLVVVTNPAPGGGTSVAATFSVTNVQTVNEWTWMSGTNKGNQPGIYGTQGVSSVANVPGGRYGAVSWIDSSGNLWLFGGTGYDANINTGLLNDLWEFNPLTQLWAWMGGSRTIVAPGVSQPGVYGSQGVPASTNIPGGRTGATSWTDGGGNFWLFGGDGYDSTGNHGGLNDLWVYVPAAKTWTWISGSSTVGTTGGGQSGVYGTQGVPSTTNVPGGRSGAISWVDSSGNLWLFGGYAEGTGLTLNDLWEFSPTNKSWAWMSGSEPGYGLNGVFGTKGVASSTNVPPSLSDAASWIDDAGNLWLFGGFNSTQNCINCSSNGYTGNNLWKFSPSSETWTWVGGSGDSLYTPGTYGTQGVASSSNIPGERSGSISWVDKSGNLWLFGGGGNGNIAGYGDAGDLNDLWVFNPTIDTWTWMSGSDGVYPRGSYGTQGLSSSTNAPYGRSGAIGWIDNSGNLWIFGGDSWLYGLGNDLWRYQPSLLSGYKSNRFNWLQISPKSLSQSIS